MDKLNDKWQQPPLDTAPGEGASGAAPGIGDHLLRRWFLLAGQLAPLIGERGFCALYGRAVRLILPDFNWLTADQSCTSTDRLFAGLKENLSAVDAASAAAANQALLTTFTKLLSSLIGEALTNRLLASAQNGELGQSKAQEHN